ncbi:TylF/MycF/NovP-related O-methyltransferase [Cohnella panacarvi]|uniref:TylF/MycF/NovP-related O-methyltransferase n=1 Tax=Cohnella panacarvi TaxID=400776 RepID=UPI00047D9C70|nr:TylF/MycF/NovP-related O-methyltransferase [Cohnella panacarvi]
MNIIVFGAGRSGKQYLKYAEKYLLNYNIVGIVDNNKSVQGNILCGHLISSTEEISTIQYDSILITIEDLDIIDEVKKQLKNLSVPDEKIEVLEYNQELKSEVITKVNIYDEDTYPRTRWLKDFSNYIYSKEIKGSVAECGVYRGYFSEFINKYFYDRKLYLFDTFTGFDQKDMDAERALNNPQYNNSKFAKGIPFKHTNEEIVLNRMQFKQNCILKKGYFPESAFDVDDSFCFVNLDMDLYAPMLSALEFFWDKMVSGGVILLHDYFHPELPGVSKAVHDFENKMKITCPKIPIGDFCSLAIIKV